MARVLLVEDDETIQSAYGLALQQDGFTVDLAGNAAGAQKLADEHQPDVILLDLLMPGISGLEFLADYDVQKEHPDAKVIVFTNLSGQGTVKRALDLGAAKVLTKSEYTPKLITAVIKEVLAKRAAADKP